MLKMALICKFGAGTGMLAKKIPKEAEKINFDASIKTFSEDKMGEVLRDNDVVLVGPQLLYKLDQIKRPTRIWPTKSCRLTWLTLGP